MTGARLSPASVLAWLASLSVDTTAAAVLDAAGARLAGDEALARRAAALLAAAAPDGDRDVRDGDLLVARRSRHAVAATLRPGALMRVARLDLAAAADALEGT
jgi:hypothetical protein